MKRITDECGWELIDTLDNAKLWRDPCGSFYSVQTSAHRCLAFLSEDTARAYMASYVKRKRYRSKVRNNVTAL